MEIVSMASQFSTETDITAPTRTQKEQEKGEMNLEKSPPKSAFPIVGTKSPLKPAAVTIDLHDNAVTQQSSGYLMDLNGQHSTTLTETRGLCQRSEEGFGVPVQFPTANHNYQQASTNRVSMPVPSPHVLNTMRDILHPEFQTYVREILNHYGNSDSQDQNYSFQQDIFNEGNFTYQETAHKCFTSFDEDISIQSGNHQNCYSSSISPRRSPRFMKSSTPRPIENKNAPKRSLLPTLSENDRYTSSASVTTPTSKMTVQSSVPKNNNKEGERISSCAIGTAPSSIAHNANNESRTVKLLESSSIEVDKANLKKASSLAKMHNNPGYALCLKLIPLLFTDEE